MDTPSTRPMFATAQARAGMYESFFLRAVSPHEPLGVWIRYTIHKAPGRLPRGSVWFTLFHHRRQRPFMHKRSGPHPCAPAGSWLSLGGDTDIGPGGARGSCGDASWSLRFASDEAELGHLSPALLYRLPLPRTKLTSPAPTASFDGHLQLGGEQAIELRNWRGMVGHNWGSQHAERWIWLHGVDFAEDPSAWLDVALGRVLVAGRMTPWVASGALSLHGRRQRLGGIAARGVHVVEGARGCQVRIPGEGGLTLDVKAGVPTGSTADWRYADPDGGEHDVLNCSVASLELSMQGSGRAPTLLRTSHGGAYELGVRERDHRPTTRRGACACAPAPRLNELPGRDRPSQS